MFTLPSATKIIKSVSKVSGKKREIRDQADRIKVFFPAYEINYLRYFCVDLDLVSRTRGWGYFLEFMHFQVVLKTQIKFKKHLNNRSIRFFTNFTFVTFFYNFLTIFFTIIPNLYTFQNHRCFQAKYAIYQTKTH